MGLIAKPTISKLAIQHDYGQFDCGNKALNTYIRLHALTSQRVKT